MSKKLSSREIYELREMLRITGMRASRFDESMTLSEVVEQKVKYIIKNEVLKPPYIACHTVFQILYGGVHWKNAEYNIKAGLLDHAGIAQPPHWYLAEQGRRFGYIMDWPPIALRNVVTGAMRNNIVNPILDGEIDVPYRIGWCKGYIAEDNGKAKYVPDYGRYISCYFIVMKDPNFLPTIKNHILHQEWWYRKQWKMTLEKLPYLVINMKRMADKVHSRATALGKMWEIDERQKLSRLEAKLNPQVPVEMIDWRVEDFRRGLESALDEEYAEPRNPLEGLED